MIGSFDSTIINFNHYWTVRNAATLQRAVNVPWKAYVGMIKHWCEQCSVFCDSHRNVPYDIPYFSLDAVRACTWYIIYTDIEQYTGAQKSAGYQGRKKTKTRVI